MKTQAAPLNNQLTVQCPPFLSERETKALAAAASDIRPHVCALRPTLKWTADLALLLQELEMWGQFEIFLEVLFSPLKVRRVFCCNTCRWRSTFHREKVGCLRQRCEDLSMSDSDIKMWHSRWMKRVRAARDSLRFFENPQCCVLFSTSTTIKQQQQLLHCFSCISICFNVRKMRKSPTWRSESFSSAEVGGRSLFVHSFVSQCYFQGCLQFWLVWPSLLHIHRHDSLWVSQGDVAGGKGKYEEFPDGVTWFITPTGFIGKCHQNNTPKCGLTKNKKTKPKES